VTTAVATRSPLRRVALTQLLGSTVDGIVLSTAVLYFSTEVGIPEPTIGAALAMAAAVALVLLLPLGMLADAIGLRAAAVVACVGAAGALLLYAFAREPVGYVTAAIVFVATQAWIGAVRQAIVSSVTDGAQRVRQRAILHTVLNGGMGLGTVVGTVLAAVGVALWFPIAYAVGAGIAIVSGFVFFSLPPAPRGEASVAAARRPGPVALRDRRFVTVTGLFALAQLTMPVLSVILPLWIVTRTTAPVWVAPVALALNTVIVLAAQTWWASRVRDAAGAARSLGLAAASLLAAGVLLGLTGVLDAAPAAVVALTGVVALTMGEIAAGAGTWQVAFHSIPDGLHGQYQAVFAMSASVARILGPAVALPLVLGLGGIGWATLGVVFALATVGLAQLARR
jgi:hypothetical protein